VPAPGFGPARFVPGKPALAGVGVEAGVRLGRSNKWNGRPELAHIEGRNANC